jgi:hypothetical protein
MVASRPAARYHDGMLRAILRPAVVALLGFVLLPLSALAIVTTPGHPLHYVAAMRPQSSQGVPFSGALVLSFSRDGIVSGTYRASSIRPDPMNGKIIPVTGGVTGKNIHLSFGMGGNFSVSGTIDAHGRIVASGFRRGVAYNFEAAVQPAKASHM